MSALPTFTEVIETLQDISRNTDHDPDRPLTELEVDSLDLAEWIAMIEGRSKLTIGNDMVGEFRPCSVAKSTIASGRRSRRTLRGLD